VDSGGKVARGISCVVVDDGVRRKHVMRADAYDGVRRKHVMRADVDDGA
jgi:hypothetical protein